MKQTPFHGQWICHRDFAALRPLRMYHREAATPDFGGEHDDRLCNTHVLFRRCFLLVKQAGRYRLRFSADDYGKVYCNGGYVGQGPTPGYIGAYHYCEADVTDFLQDGENVLTVHAYYQGLINRVWISGDLRMGVIADLIAPDGTVLLSTDTAWECAVIPNYVSERRTGYDTQYLEDYDARIPMPPFEKAAIREYDDVVFRPDPAPMPQVYRISPVRCETLPDGGVFCDFGTELTGAIFLRAVGKSGDTVRILCGEETDDSPCRVRYEMRCNCTYDETWTLADGENVLDQYDYKAFRYVTLLSDPASVRLDEIAVTVRHAAFDGTACTLRAEDPILGSVFDICKNAVKYGTQEVYVDCPTREKGQYAGDMTVTSGSQLWLTGNPYMLEKGIRDQAYSAIIDPGLMAVTSGALMQEIADYSLQFPLLLLRHYAFTRDRGFLASMLPVAEQMLAHFAAFAREDGLIQGVDKWNLVDWPDNLRDGYDFPLTIPVGMGVHNVINAFYIGCTVNIEQIKDILGIPHDHSSRILIESFNRVFFDRDTGLYVDAEGSRHSAIHSNIMPAFYGIVPPGAETGIADYLTEKGMVCGVYMAYFLLKALCRLGRHEDAYRLITSTGEHSWYNMVREGGTTCFEAWGKDQKWNTSLCHPWASAPVTVLIEDLMGISPDGTVGECRIPADAGKIELTVPTRAGSVTVTANAPQSEGG